MRRMPCFANGMSPIAERLSTLIDINCQLASLVRSGEYKHAVELFVDVHRCKTLKPDQYTVSTALTAIARLRDAIFGGQVHCFAIRSGLVSHSHVSNTLLSLQAKSGDLVSLKKVFWEIKEPDVYSWTTLLSACFKLGDRRYACELFDKMPRRDDVAVWNAMITGCMENGLDGMGIDLFREMHKLGVRHDNYSLASVLSVCLCSLLDFGKQVHSLAIKTGFLVKPSVVNALITMYFNCQVVSGARLVFEGVDDSVRDQISFNVMIDGLASFQIEEALLVFRKMLDACLRPTELTFVSLMSSCSQAGLGRQVHGLVIKMGFEGYTPVTNSAIAMYSSFGDLNTAHRLFESLVERDSVTWNTMISTYTQAKLGESAVSIYKEMQRVGIKPDEFTFGSLLASSENLKAVEMIQVCVHKCGLISKTEVSNALISAYAKHGEIEKAILMFRMSSKNLISWNTIISGSFLNGFPLKALEQFSCLLESESLPDACTLSILLSICTSISSLRLGKQIHSYILRHGHFFETSVSNALITMYSKCGALHRSLKVFNKMTHKDIVSWNSLISAYSQHGEGQRAVLAYKAMQEEANVKPDPATFTAILSACSHAGLISEGLAIFNSMVKDHGFGPNIDHFACIVDLLARAGYLEDAENVIRNSQKNIGAHSNVWWSLFSACAAHGDLKLGRTVAELLVEQEKNNPSVYVLLSNIYAAAGQWKEARDARESMKMIGAIKQKGCSWIRL